MTLELKANPQAAGGYELFENGNRIATGTKEALEGRISSAQGPQETAPTQSGTSAIARSNVRRFTQADPGDTSFSSAANDFFNALDITPPTETEISDIKQQSLADVQRELDAIDAATASLLSDEGRRADVRSGRGRAISARSGVLTSDKGEQRREEIEGVNKGAREAIIAAQEAKKVAVFDKAATRAAEIAEARKTEALTNAENFLNFMASKQEEARADLKTLAGSGVPLETMNEDDITALQEQTGYDPFIFDAVYNANLPGNEKREYHYENLGSGRVVRFDEAGGQPEFFDYSIPDGFTFKMAGDIPVFINEKTQEVRIATPEGGLDEAGAFAKETELDTFTNAQGDRVSVLYNPVTKKTRQVNHGKTGGSSGGAFPSGFKPQAFEVSAVNQFITNEGSKEGQSQDEIDEALQAARTDPGFFYSTLGVILADDNFSKNYYKPTTLGIPTTVQVSTQ